ncbi:MAG: NUDIX domain-containing protein [Trueperaceae bacterium]|nr:MAG: NUDIX domain-containing protein [Trueperaceae bacterium]
MANRSTLSKPQITRVAAYGLVLQDDHILLCRISTTFPDAGYWTLPGGGLNFGEDPVYAMHREVNEETGLLVEASGLAGIDSVHLDLEDRFLHGIRIIFHTELIGGSLTPEVEGSTDFCAWWTCEEAKNLDLVDLAEVGLDLAFPIA